jgi:hypothetical protein
MVVVVDGGDSERKRHERQRRDISRETATSNSESAINLYTLPFPPRSAETASLIYFLEVGAMTNGRVSNE